MIELSRKQARRLMLGAQQLAGPPPKRPTKTKMLETIRGLGVLQIDTISVVARSHHLVLWSRLGDHPHEWLDELYSQDSALFEYWAHAAAFVPIELFPYFRGKMLCWEGNLSARRWMDQHADLLDEVMEHVRHNGGVTTKSFSAPEGTARAEAWSWYGNKPTNVALDILWTRGELMIVRRDRFQRVYDLTERVMPAWSDDQLPSVDEVQLKLAETALNALGVATEFWLPDYFRPDWSEARITRPVARELFDRLIELGLAAPARVEGVPGMAVVAASALERNARLSRTTLLSPFDSLIWDRRRARELWDFEVQLEIYIPQPKRRYGYFSLPILYRDQLVGRLDPKADRKAGVLYVNALHLEPWFIGSDDERFYAALAATLDDFRAFNRVDEIVVTRADPEQAAERLRVALAAH
jgi:uncharacterized protein YcaQ